MVIENKLFTTAYTKEINEKERTLVAWGSKAIIDREKEIIRGDAWDLTNYQKHPVIILSHQYKDLWVGKALWLKTSDEGLLFKAQFATTDSAQEAFQLVKDTGIAAFSVGFIPKKWEDKKVSELDEIDQKMVKSAGLTDRDTVRIHTKCELLEISLVSVPSCSTAVMTAYNEGKIKTKELKTKLDEIIEIVEEKIEIVTKPEETEDYIHIRVRDPGDFQEDSFRTIDIDKGKGIKAVIGRLKGETTTTVQKYIFDKSKGWTMASAQAWVNDNKKEYEELNIEDEKEEIKEEKIETIIPKENNSIIELATKYGILLAEKTNLEEEIKKEINEIKIRDVAIKELETKIEEIELKQGAVLNRKNKTDLKDAQGKIQGVLDSAEPLQNESIEIEIEETKEEKKDKLDIDINEIKNIINDAIKAQVNNVTDNLKEEINNNFKRITGKVM